MKKILFLFMLLLAVQVAYAQMTDKQIVDYIKTEQGKGTNQQDIVKSLMARGVTANQITRIRQQIERENKQTKTETVESEERLRTQEEPEPVDVEQQATPVNVEETVFGRNIFNNKLLTFEPSLNIPIPSNYVLGAGDKVIIDIWGASQAVIDDVISPEGVLVAEGVGPVRLAGKTVAEANEYVKEVIGRIYAESNVSLSVGSVRSIQVQVMGEVVAPGNYTVSALSTAFNALYAAGGINDLGTLRSINVYREGKLLSTIDVYDYILHGKTAGNVRLQDNDVISVGAYNALVKIGGSVKRPMFYEMKENETLSSLVSYSGGFSADAYTEKMRVVRKNGRQYSIHMVERDNMSTFALRDGDDVSVDSIVPRYSNMVEIAGAVFYPGVYQFGESVKTVKELIEAAGGVREDAFLARAVLQHRNYDNTIESQAVDIAGILSGTLPDVALRNNDIILIPSKSEMEGRLTIIVGGEVRVPGTYEFAENTTIEDAILNAGGLTRAASKVKVDCFRYKYDQYAKKDNKEKVVVYSFEIKDGFVVDGDPGFVLQPFDEVYVRRSPMYIEKQNVTVAGEVSYDGNYVLTNTDYRLSDLIKAAGGFTEQAYVKGAYLYRKMNGEELEQRDIYLKQTQIELLEEALKEENTNVAILDSLYKAKQNLSHWYPVAINLEAAIANPGGEEDIILRVEDALTVPKKSTTVKISGEVRHPITVTWQEGKNLKYYVNHAGGYNDKAKKKGAYVVQMNGNIEKLSKRSSKTIEPGCEIVIPRKATRHTTTAEIMSYGTSAASISAMIVALINLLK